MRSSLEQTGKQTNANSPSQPLQPRFVDTRYRLLRKVGSGAYGFVVAATDTLRDKQVAIKKIGNAFDDLVDAKRMLREVRLMRQFDHPNIVKLYDIMEPPSLEDFKDIYIVTELMSTDLQKILYSKTRLSAEQEQYLLYQLLAGVKYVHSANVLHRDLKPSNLLIDVQTCRLRICDFGLARGATRVIGVSEQVDECKTGKFTNERGAHAGAVEEHEYTEYVVTRWYRAPEIMSTYGVSTANAASRIFVNHVILPCSKLTQAWLPRVQSCHRYVKSV